MVMLSPSCLPLTHPLPIPNWTVMGQLEGFPPRSTASGQASPPAGVGLAVSLLPSDPSWLGARNWEKMPNNVFDQIFFASPGPHYPGVRMKNSAQGVLPNYIHFFIIVTKYFPLFCKTFYLFSGSSRRKSGRIYEILYEIILRIFIGF